MFQHSNSQKKLSKTFSNTKSGKKCGKVGHKPLIRETMKYMQSTKKNREQQLPHLYCTDEKLAPICIRACIGHAQYARSDMLHCQQRLQDISTMLAVTSQRIQPNHPYQRRKNKERKRMKLCDVLDYKI